MSQYDNLKSIFEILSFVTICAVSKFDNSIWHDWMISVFNIFPLSQKIIFFFKFLFNQILLVWVLSQFQLSWFYHLSLVLIIKIYWVLSQFDIFSSLSQFEFCHNLTLCQIFCKLDGACLYCLPGGKGKYWKTRRMTNELTFTFLFFPLKQWKETTS